MIENSLHYRSHHEGKVHNFIKNSTFVSKLLYVVLKVFVLLHVCNQKQIDFVHSCWLKTMNETHIVKMWSTVSTDQHKSWDISNHQTEPWTVFEAQDYLYTTWRSLLYSNLDWKVGHFISNQYTGGMQYGILETSIWTFINACPKNTLLCPVTAWEMIKVKITSWSLASGACICFTILFIYIL